MCLPEWSPVRPARLLLRHGLPPASLPPLGSPLAPCAASALGYWTPSAPVAIVVGMTQTNQATIDNGTTIVVSPSNDRHGGRVGVVVASPVAGYTTVKFADGGDTETLPTSYLLTVKH